MKSIATALLCVALLMAGGTAFAQDAMKKDSMAKDGMKTEAMATDATHKGEMKK